MTDTNGHTPAPDDALFPDDVPIPRYPLMSVTISAVSPEGFPVSTTLNDPIPGAVHKRIAALVAQGYVPATAAPAGTRAPAGDGGVPVCPYHGPMKESTVQGKEGTYYCPKKMADGSGYCKERYPK